MNQMRLISRSKFTVVWVAVMAMLPLTTGCTSALTTAYLSGTPWSLRESHAAIGEDPRDSAAEPSDDASSRADSAEPRVEDAAADDRDDRRAAAIEEAVTRLSGLGVLDEATQAALVATLQRTAQEDWPIVVEEFAAALASTAQVSTTTAAETRTAAKPDAGPSTATVPDAPVPPDEAPPEPPAAPQVEAASGGLPDAAVEPAAPPPRLQVNNASFASRVQAWGALDRFPADRFQPGQEVIVYFELDNLSSHVSPAGHSTCIDASLRLLDDAGRTLQEWNFEPIAETCGGRRRDYFARYVVRMPSAAEPGTCRLEMTVTDMLADATATASLPLEIAPD